MRVRSLASLSGLRIRRCREPWCGSQTWLGFRVALALVQARGCSSDSTPSLGTSMCRGGAALKKKEKEKKKKNKDFHSLKSYEAFRTLLNSSNIL